MTLTELRDALARATGPEWQLDEALTVALYNPSLTEPTIARQHLPFTGSMDAATTLVPAGVFKSVDGPRSRASLDYAPRAPNIWRCAFYTRGVKPLHVTGWGATEELATCGARVELEIAKAAQVARLTVEASTPSNMPPDFGERPPQEK